MAGCFSDRDKERMGEPGYDAQEKLLRFKNNDLPYIVADRLARRGLDCPRLLVVADLREQAWTLATDTPLPSGGDEEVIERVYGLVGDESLDGLGIATPPQVSELADAALARFLQSDQGKDFIAAAAAAQDQQPQP